MAITQTGAVIIAEIPVVTAAAFAAVGFMVRRLFNRVDEQEAVQAQHAVGMAEQNTRLTAVELLAASHERRLPTMAENLAIVAAFVERHERWHERHETPSPSPPEK